MAARELLRYPTVERIVLVDLDRAVTDVFRTVPAAVKLNGDSLNDPRVTVVNEDAFGYVKRTPEAHDLIVIDFPDPSNYALGKLYTLTFYRYLRERLGVRGVGVVQATSPYFARESYWSIVNTIRAAGFTTFPMHVYVPTFGEWGFVLIGGTGLRPPTAPTPGVGGLKFLNRQTMTQLFQFPPDMKAIPAPINRLNDQKLEAIYTREWAKWTR